MTIFEELCQFMQQGDNRRSEFFTAARKMSFDLADCLRLYIESPAEWMELDQIGKASPDVKPYIYPVSVDKNGNEVHKDGHPFVNMYITDDKFYLFNLVVTLEKGVKIYPKSTYRFACGVRPQAQDRCRLFVAYTFGNDPNKREFQCNNRMGFIEPAKYVVQLLTHTLEVGINIFD